MSSFKTAKGTELPILRLKGKDYLEVKYRLVWFREERPDWSIETEFLSVTEKAACAKAIIKDVQGRIIATGHKTETERGFPDFMEKAETGAIGRALALIGYGTQFCGDDLDEGERIVDSPVARPTAPGIAPEQPAPGDGRIIDRGYRIDFGQWKSRSLEQVYRDEGPEAIISYIKYLETNAAKKNKVISPNEPAGVFIREAEHFLGVMENAEPVS